MINNHNFHIAFTLIQTVLQVLCIHLPLSHPQMQVWCNYAVLKRNKLKRRQLRALPNATQPGSSQSQGWNPSSMASGTFLTTAF